MFLKELEEHIRKLDKTMTLRLGNFQFRIPALGLKKEDKEILKENRAAVEEMLSEMGIVTLLSVLEYSLRDFCLALKKSKSLKLSWAELRGEPLERFKVYFEKVGGISIGISPSDWEDLQSLNTLRNVFIHSLGEIQEKDLMNIRKLTERFKAIEIKQKKVLISLEFCHTMLTHVQEIFVQSLGKLAQVEIERIQKRN